MPPARRTRGGLGTELGVDAAVVGVGHGWALPERPPQELAAVRSEPATASPVQEPQRPPASASIAEAGDVARERVGRDFAAVGAADAAATAPATKMRQEKSEAAPPMEADEARPSLADELAPAPPPAAPPPAAVAALSMARAPEPDGPRGAPGSAIAPRTFGLAAEAAGGAPPELAIQPLLDEAAQVRVAADGWISVRSVSAEGRVTITDVYAP